MPVAALIAVAVLIAPGGGDGRVFATVAADPLEVLDEPSDTAFPTGQLRRGDRVEIVGRRDGWAAIVPPRGSLSWIDQAAIEPVDGDKARVIADAAPVRPGAVDARLPGRPQATLARDAVVRRLDQPPLTLRQGGRRVTLVAIAPPRGERRYVKAEGLDLPESGPVKLPSRDEDLPAPPVAGEPQEAAIGEAIPPPARPPSRKIEAETPAMGIDPRFAGVGPIGDESGLPPDLSTRLVELEADHRGRLRQRVESWDLEPVRRAYQDLLKTYTDPASQAALTARLRRVERQRDFAQRSTRLEALLGKARTRDRELTNVLNRVTRAEAPSSRPYAAQGMLQVSSRQVDGERVFALIGRSGETTAYLRVPPGLSADRLLTRRVGVRGDVRYDEALRARVIRVQDLDPLGYLDEPEPASGH